MKKIISLVLIVIIICSSISGCLWDDIIKQMGFTTTNPEYEGIVWEEKIYWEGNVSANFVVGELVVVLDKAISVPNKVHSLDFFEGVDVVKIYDCTQRENPENVWKDFRQILHLTLADTYDTKEKTLEAMRILAPIPGIKSVSPNVILSPLSEHGRCIRFARIPHRGYSKSNMAADWICMLS